jgi:hypothetical protein
MTDFYVNNKNNKNGGVRMTDDNEILVNPEIENVLEFTTETAVSDFGGEWDFWMKGRSATLFNNVTALGKAFASGKIGRLLETSQAGKAAIFFTGEWFDEYYRYMNNPNFQVCGINTLKGQNDIQPGSVGGQIISAMFQTAVPFIGCEGPLNCTGKIENFLTNGDVPPQINIEKLPLPPFADRNPLRDFFYTLRYCHRQEVRVEIADCQQVTYHDLRYGPGSYFEYLDKVRENSPFLGIVSTRPLLPAKDHIDSQSFELKIKRWTGEHSCRFTACFNETFNEQVLVKMAEQLWGDFKLAAVEKAFPGVSF